MEHLLRDYWAVIVGFVGLVVWFVRMEGRVNAHEIELKRIASQRHEDREREAQDRAEIKAMLKDLATEIKEMRKEVRQ
jgi:hypothetical protein